MDILKAIGNTSLVRLRRVVPPHCADVLVKLARRPKPSRITRAFLRRAGFA